MSTASNTPEMSAVVNALAAEGERTPDRLKPAVDAGEGILKRRLPAKAYENAVAHWRQALIAAGAAALEGGDPQAVENALFAAHPDSPIDERAFRLAWLAVVDHLSRSGDKPPFGGAGKAESWALTAASRPWPHVDLGGVAKRIADMHGTGQHVVVVRGPGRSACLAEVRRLLLGAHGAKSPVTPVMPGARDDWAPVLKPLLEQVDLPEQLTKIIPQLRYGEDFVGLMGRAGDSAPVAMIVDHGHIQSRSLLLGLALYLEPAPERKALLVMGAPEDPKFDGPLSEIIGDARGRGILTEFTLSDWNAEVAGALVNTWYGDTDHGAVTEALVAALDGVLGEGAFGAARAWLSALEGQSVDEAVSSLKAGFDPEPLLPKSTRAREILAAAALEGQLFHGFAVGKVFGRDEDFIEDLLFDDELEIDGEVVGTCEAAIPPGAQQWTDLPDGLHPIFEFGDMRLVIALRRTFAPELARGRARALRDHLLQGYQQGGAWQVSGTLWNLDQIGGRDRRVEGLLVGRPDAQRVQAAFGRMRPVLDAKAPYGLALARLYGAGMEAGALGAQVGQLQFADQGFQAAAAAAQRLQRPGPAGEALARLAEMRIALSLPQQAGEALQVARQLLEAAQHDRSLARLDLMQAEVHILDADLATGEQLLEQAVGTLRGLGDQGHVALGLTRMGRLVFERGDAGRAKALLDEAVGLADQLGDPRPRAAARMARAHVAAHEGDLQPAFQLLQQAAQLFQAVGMPVHTVETAAAGLQRRSGAPEQAEERLRKVAEAFKQARAAVQWADAWQEVAQCLIDQESFSEAVMVVRETEEVRQRARDRFALMRMYDSLGQALIGSGDPARAYGAFARGRRIAEILSLGNRMGGFDAEMAKLTSALDQRADADPTAISAEAVAFIDELEARWKAPPQPVQQPKQVH
ncbi:MAG: hypothetical protein ACE366_01400 [Bradymonadia bacterium]